MRAYLMPHPPVLLPEVGCGREREIQDTLDACMRVGEEISKENPETIVLITPHGPVFSDAIAISTERLRGNLSKFGAPNISKSIDIDTELTEIILNKAEAESIPVVDLNISSVKKYGLQYELDHGAIIPLYFLKGNYEFVHITYGMLSKIDLYHFGMLINDAAKLLRRNIVVIASGDLSHRLTLDGPYPFSKYGKQFDEEIIKHLETGNGLGVFNMDLTTINEAGECGLRSIYIALGALKGEFIGELYSYEGPFGVGYGVLKMESVNDNDYFKRINDKIITEYFDKLERANTYVRLARDSIEHYLNTHTYLEPPAYTNEIKNVIAGTFVSIKKEGHLRGCIGTILPTRVNVIEEIIHNAVSAAVRDPRFAPIDKSELTSLDISVDILNEPVSAKKEDLDPFKYGVIVRQGSKSGVLLPHLEGIDTVDEQLSIALRKANIIDGDYSIERFEVIRYE